MRSLLSAAARGGCALSLGLLAMAVLRWGPVHAEPLIDVRALSLAGPTLLLAILAALTGRERPVRRAGPWLWALLVSGAALAAVVMLRGETGLRAEVSDPRGVVAHLPPGPIDVVGPELRSVPRVHRWTFRWDGALRVPESGAYRLWAVGRGQVEVRLHGRVVLRGEGERLHVGADLPLGRGEHAIAVRLDRIGPGPRLRLGWVRAAPGGHPGGRNEMISPRFLGPRAPLLLWRLTDMFAVTTAALLSALVFVLPWDCRRRLPSPGPITSGEIGLSLAGHAALVALMSWPLILDLAGAGVLDQPDGRLNAWILAWNAHALLDAPGRLFQAPIFHPLPDALAYSENLLLPAVLAAPAILAGGPVLGFNLALIVSYVVSGLGAQLLVRRVSGARLAAFVGGAFFAVGVHRWTKMAHLHAQVTLFLPFALLAFDRFWERRTLRRGLLVGLLLALQGLSSVYLGAITATALAVATAVALAAGLRGRQCVNLGAGFLLAVLILAPLARPYFRMRGFQGVEFTLEDLAVYATSLESYVASPGPLYFPLTQRHLDPERVRDLLFPGLVPVVLGVCGLAAAPRRYRAMALAATAVAVVISLGPQTPFYRFIHEHADLFRGIRALSRFSLIPVLSLAVLTGLALAGRGWAALLALALFVLETSQAPLHYAPYAGPPPSARWLAGKPGAVVSLPLGTGDTLAMLDGVAHFRPLLNGDSGFIPRPYTRVMELLEDPLSEEALRFLRAVGTRHILTRDDRPLPLAIRMGEDRIYEVPPGDVARNLERGRPVAALWSRAGVRVDLGSSATVGRVVFELSDARWIETPAVAVSLDGISWRQLRGHASLADATLSLTADPRGAFGAVSFEQAAARYVHLDARLPARPGSVFVTP